MGHTVYATSDDGTQLMRVDGRWLLRPIGGDEVELTDQDAVAAAVAAHRSRGGTLYLHRGDDAFDAAVRAELAAAS